MKATPSQQPQSPATKSAGFSRQRGAALLIVLAFIVLLLVLLLAFFSRATLQEQISKSSASTTLVDVFAEGATESIIGDLRQEIVAGSSVTNIVITSGGISITNSLYFPVSNVAIEPAISGFVTNGNLLNLVKISSPTNFSPSSSNSLIYTNIANNPVINRASGVSSTNPSLNNRYMTPARWNEPLLLGFSTNSTGTDTTPDPSFVPPSWILVARDGSNPTNWSTNMGWSSTNTTTVIGRYSYAIYNEGGMLDANVAGYPTNVSGATTGLTASTTGYKSAEAFADLSEIGMTPAEINALVAWRNFASASASGTYPNYTFTRSTNYPLMAWGNTNGFMSISANYLGTNAQGNLVTDRMFTSRQQLIQFMENADGTPTGMRNAMNLMQNLSTHTRDINQPSFAPATNRPFIIPPQYGGNSSYTNAPGVADNLINPSFLTIRVTNSFTRNDGKMAQVGEPLVKKRFALNRIAWLTYKGPSATLYQQNKNDPEILALLSNGISLGMITNGTSLNIQHYFGLTWQNGTWLYNLHNGAGGRGTTGPINTLSAIAALPSTAAHDPDFFEMLKASISAGSLGRALVSGTGAISSTNLPVGYISTNQIPDTTRYSIESSVDDHIIQIGANIINQFHADSYPRRILFNDGKNTGIGNAGLEFDGVSDLPYITYIYNGALRQGNNAVIIQVPVVWNMYDPNSRRPPTGLFPTSLQATLDNIDLKSIQAGLTTPSPGTWLAAEGMLPSGTTAFSYGNSKPPLLQMHSVITISAVNNGTNNLLFREPTWLIRQNTTGPGNVYNLTMSGPSAISLADANPIGGANDGVGKTFFPWVLGSVPLTFPFPVTNNGVVSSNNVISQGAWMGPSSSVTSENRVYFTYRMSYTDPNNNQQVYYDVKSGRVSNGQFNFNNSTSVAGVPTPSVGLWATVNQQTTWGAAIDPRSSRFGLFMGAGTGYPINEYAVGPSVTTEQGHAFSNSIWVDAQNGLSLPLRPDQCSGHIAMEGDGNDPFVVTNNVGGYYAPVAPLPNDMPMQDIPYPRATNGWAQTQNVAYALNKMPTIAFGMYAQNHPSVAYNTGRFLPDALNSGSVFPQGNSPAYYADPDGVVRRGSDAYVGQGTLSDGVIVGASNPIGQPSAVSVFANSKIFGLQTNWDSDYTGKYPTNAQVVPFTTIPLSQSQSRPLFLHRPFRSVAELSYVYRDLPYKNIDFYTPESGDKALLDTFCINDTSDPNNLVAGRIDLNSRKTNVISALINGSYIDDPRVTNTTIGTISRNLSIDVATAFLNYTSTNIISKAVKTGPLINISDVIGRYVTNGPIIDLVQGGDNSGGADQGHWGLGLTLSINTPAGATNNLPTLKNPYIDGKLSYAGFAGFWATNGYSSALANAADLSTAYSIALSSTNMPYFLSMQNIQRFHEAPIRALSAAGQTRVWNLMIDVVAQTGRYPGSASTPNNFMVEGEERYWIHLSIDRFTGEVIDKQIEPVKE